MTTLHLPLRELPLPGESLTGYLRRHVTAMGYQGLTQLLGLLEGVSFPPHLDHLPKGAASAALAQFLRRDADVLREMTAHRWAEQLVLQRRDARAPEECDSKTLLRYFHAARGREVGRPARHVDDSRGHRRRQLAGRFVRSGNQALLHLHERGDHVAQSGAAREQRIRHDLSERRGAE